MKTGSKPNSPSQGRKCQLHRASPQPPSLGSTSGTSELYPSQPQPSILPSALAQKHLVSQTGKEDEKRRRIRKVLLPCRGHSLPPGPRDLGQGDETGAHRTSACGPCGALTASLLWPPQKPSSSNHSVQPKSQGLWGHPVAACGSVGGAAPQVLGAKAVDKPQPCGNKYRFQSATPDSLAYSLIQTSLEPEVSP